MLFSGQLRWLKVIIDIFKILGIIWLITLYLVATPMTRDDEPTDLTNDANDNGNCNTILFSSNYFIFIDYK